MPNPNSIAINIKTLNTLLKAQTPLERINTIVEVTEDAVFVSQLDLAGQYLTWLFSLADTDIKIATLKNSLLFPEFASLVDITQSLYAVEIEQMSADRPVSGVKTEVKGLRSLQSILSDVDAYLVAGSIEQSDEHMFVEWDSDHELLRFAPLADVSLASIVAEILAHEIPVDPALMAAFSKEQTEAPMRISAEVLKSVQPAVFSTSASS